MFPKTILCLGLVSMIVPWQSVSAQTKPAPAPPVAVTLASSSRFQEDSDGLDETDQEALAKQLDEFQKRIKQLEQYALDLQDDEKEGSFADRLTALEESTKKQLDSIGQLDKALDGYVRSGHGGSYLRVFGRIHTDFLHFASEGDDIDVLEGGDPQDRFIFRRLRLGVDGRINDNMLYRIEAEFGDGDEPSYRDAWLGFDHLPFFNRVLIGNQKRPYGLDHLNNSNNNVFLERPLIVDALNFESRRLGIASYGYSDDLRFNWQYGIFHQGLTQDTDGFVSDNFQLEYASRFAHTWWYDECSGGRGYGHIAVASSYGSPDGLGGASNAAQFGTHPEARTDNLFLDTGAIVGADKTNLAAIEGVLNIGALNLTAEYQGIDVDRLDSIGAHVQFHGGYVQASYFLTGEHMPWNRRTGTLGRVKPFENFFAVRDHDGFVQRGMGAWQIAARYSYADLSDLDIDGGRGRALTLGLNWHWNPSARMQFNYILGDIESETTVAGDYQILGARFQVDF